MDSNQKNNNKQWQGVHSIWKVTANSEDGWGEEPIIVGLSSSVTAALPCQFSQHGLRPSGAGWFI